MLESDFESVSASQSEAPLRPRLSTTASWGPRVTRQPRSTAVGWGPQCLGEAWEDNVELAASSAWRNVELAASSAWRNVELAPSSAWRNVLLAVCSSPPRKAHMATNSPRRWTEVLVAGSAGAGLLAVRAGSVVRRNSSVANRPGDRTTVTTLASGGARPPTPPVGPPRPAADGTPLLS